MTLIPAFLPLLLRWKPTGASSSRVLENAFCLLDLQGDSAAHLRRVVGNGSLVTHASTDGLRVLARTDGRGVLSALPADGPSALDPLSLSAVAPILFPIGARFSLWWTHDASTFDQVQRAAKEAGHDAPAREAVQLVFDHETPLPPALDALLVELEHGLEVLPVLQRRQRDTYPEHLLQLADDGSSLCVELSDPHLEVAYHAAYRLLSLMRLPDEHKLPAHRMLLGKVRDILHLRGARNDPRHDLVTRHERLGGTEYRSLEQELKGVAHACTRQVQEAGKALLKVYEPAFLELSMHPYPEGSLHERGTGPVSQRYAAQLMLEAVAVALRGSIEQKLYAANNPALEARLLKIVQGEQDPEQRDAAEKYFAKVSSVISWLSKKSSYVRNGAKLGKEATDPKLVEPLTKWIEPLVVSAARAKQVGPEKLRSAAVRGMRMAQTWCGLDANFDFAWRRRDVKIHKLPETEIELLEAPPGQWHMRFKRASELLKLLNALSLADGMMKADGERPSVLKQMTDLHGFIEGLESTYRVLTDTAKTELGVVLKSMTGLVTGVGIYLAVEDTWSSFRTGSSYAAQLSASTMVLAVLGAALELAVAAPHPAVKLLLIGAGVVLAIATAYRYDDDEEYLEQYRPGCGEDGAYAEAKNVVRRMRRELNEAEWENQEAHRQVDRLLA